MQPIGKIVLSLIVMAIAAIPLWFYLILQHFLQPEGFWQKLILVGAGFYFLGFLQLIFLIVGVVLVFVLWTEA